MPPESPRPEAASDSSEPPPSSDKRRAQRATYVNFVWFCSLLEETKRGLARTVDISDQGVGFLTNHNISPNERLFLIVVTRLGQLAAVARAAHVASVDGTHHRVGAVLEIMAPTDQAMWMRLCREEKP